MDFTYMQNIIRTIGNFIAEDDHICNVYVQEMGLLETVKNCITIGSKSHKKEALWLLSNVAANSEEDATAIIKKGLMINLINGAKDRNYDVRKEAIWAISNLCNTIKNSECIIDMI